MWDNEKVVLGVCGCLYAYKAADIASLLLRHGFDVHPVMTPSACSIIAPAVLEDLTNNSCPVEMFEGGPNQPYKTLATGAKVLLIAPASANTLAKIAHGMADDLISCTALACDCIKLVAPSMLQNMYNNPAVQDNLARLRELGYKVIPAGPDGHMAPPETVVEYLLNALEPQAPAAPVPPPPPPPVGY